MNVDKNAIAPVQPGASAEDAAIARAVRGLVRGPLKGSLATIDAQTGHPYASLVTVATDPEGRPVFLISKLALHTRNLAADNRASLLFDATDGHAKPLAGARTTLMGRAHVTTSASARSRFLARHPGSAGAADFPDFSFWALAVERAHYIGGFGCIRTLTADVLKAPATLDDLATKEAELMTDLNYVRPPSCGQPDGPCGSRTRAHGTSVARTPRGPTSPMARERFAWISPTQPRPSRRSGACSPSSCVCVQRSNDAVHTH